MTLAITPLHPCLGARVDGVVLARPVDDQTFRQIFDAFQEYSVLVFSDQRLTDDLQIGGRWPGQVYVLRQAPLM